MRLRRRPETNGLVMVGDVDISRADATRTHTLEVARSLTAGGFDVELIAFGSDPGVAGLRFRPAGTNNLPFVWRVAAVNRRALAALWSSRRCASVCYVRHYWSLVPVYFAARALDYRIVSQVDDMAYGPGYAARPPGPRAWLADYARRMAAAVMVRAADSVVAVTDGIGNLLVRDYGLSREKMHVLPNGVDIDFFAPRPRDEAIRRIGLDPDCCYLLFVGLFAEWVDFDTMLHALAHVARERPEVRLLLVGDGSERPAVERLVEELSLAGHVTLTGFVPDRTRIVDFLGAASVCLVAHRAEHVGHTGVSPVKLAEYFAAGRPVVGIAIGGVREMIENHGAGIAVSAEPTAMAKAILELLDDPRRQEAMGAAARRAAEAHYSWRSIGERTIRAFGAGMSMLAM